MPIFVTFLFEVHHMYADILNQLQHYQHALNISDHIQYFLCLAPNQPASAIEVDFWDMLEKEEEDFANQIRKQKSFLQNVFREKEELAQLCVNQTAKLSKLESERMEWQRKIMQSGLRIA